LRKPSLWFKDGGLGEVETAGPGVLHNRCRVQA
jgi:hypothetical protein